MGIYCINFTLILEDTDITDEEIGLNNQVEIKVVDMREIEKHTLPRPSQTHLDQG